MRHLVASSDIKFALNNHLSFTAIFAEKLGSHSKASSTVFVCIHNFCFGVGFPNPQEILVFL